MTHIHNSNPIRLMHFSDVHFGVENYGRFDAETGLNSRLLDFRNSLTEAIDGALTSGVDCAIFTGDAYKTRDPNQTHQREFAACIRRLTSQSVPVVLLAGNHDIPNARGRANSIEIFAALASDLVHVLDRAMVLQVPTRRGQILQIASLPYITRSSQVSREESAGKGVQETVDIVADKYKKVLDSLRAECRKNPDLPTILMGHFTVSTASIGQTQTTYLTNEPQAPKGELTNADFDYVALGHIHKFQDLNLGYQPPIVYSGSIERIDFGERNEPKGYVMADIARGHTQYKFVEVGARPFIEIDVDLTRGNGDPTDRLLDAIRKHDLSRAIVKLTYRISSADAPLLREPQIRAVLSTAFLVAAIHKDIVRDDKRDQSRLLTESLDPISGLAAYIETRESLRPRRDELLDLARKLLDDSVHPAA